MNRQSIIGCLNMAHKYYSGIAWNTPIAGKRLRKACRDRILLARSKRINSFNQPRAK